MQSAKFQRLKEILCCPDTGVDLIFRESSAISPKTGKIFAIRNNKIYFTKYTYPKNELNDLKTTVRSHFGGLYHSVLVPLFAPGFPFDLRKYVKKHLDIRPDSIIIDLGGGNVKSDENIYNLDHMDYGEVDIICDIECLPFKPNSVDAFISNGVLEHIPNVSVAVDKMKAATKMNGSSVHHTPFCYPFHASPHDFWRFTDAGLREMYKDWQVVEQFNSQGPFSLLATFFGYFFGALFSLGNRTLMSWLTLILLAFFSPIKWLDFLTIRRASGLLFAPHIVSHFRKDHIVAKRQISS